MSAFRTSGGLMQIAAIHFRDADNVLVDAGAGQFRNATGALKAFFSAFSASASPTSVMGYGNAAGTPTMTTSVTAATPDGGVAPFTYAWTRADADPQAWTINDPTAAITDFSCHVSDGATATFICTITDSTGATAATQEVSANVFNLGGGL